MSTKYPARVLGTARYTATWIEEGKLASLNAQGMLPCYNYEVEFSEGAQKIDPPIWDLMFIIEEVCSPALKPFNINIPVRPNHDDAVLVSDASGLHNVPIVDQVALINSTDFDTTEKDEFIVYAMLPKSDEGHHGCKIIPADFLVTAVHYAAFGPATNQECLAFIKENCFVKEGLTILPWEFWKQRIL